MHAMNHRTCCTLSMLAHGKALCAIALLCAFASACGNFIEFEPPQGAAGAPSPPATPASPVGQATPPVAGDPSTRAFYARCAAEHALAPTVDGAALSEVLSRRVAVDASGLALVDYLGWAADATDRATLDSYRADLGTAQPRTCDLAFWINAYNASVIAGVLDNFGLDRGYSVSNDDFAFFTATRYPVAGMQLSLDELEHGVVRGQWDHPSVVNAPDLAAMMTAHVTLWGADTVDARIHMALNCAARGCPNLATALYGNATLDADLDRNTGAFLADALKGAGPNGVTQLFDWFAADFVADSGSVDAFIARYRAGGLDGVNSGAFLEYDWTLNTQ